MIAITGGAASGKSTILREVARREFRTISADAVVSELWQSEQFLVAVAEGLGISNPTRATVRELILQEPAKRRVLNSLTHSTVVHQLLTSGADFVEIPLLVETCLVGRFEELWVCDCDRMTQMHRLLIRGLSEPDAEALLAAQMPSSVRNVFADEIFRTNGDIPNVLSQIDFALRRGRTR